MKQLADATQGRAFLPTRRTLLGALVAAPAILRVTRAGAAEVTLRLHHFLSGVSTGHTQFLQPWAEKVAADSGGRLKIEVFPSMQLGGKPPQLFDQARDGVADLVYTLPGYTSGRFPKIETIELPFVASRTSAVNTAALQAFAEKHLVEEFGEVHPICFCAHDRGLIHANRRVATLEDLAGLRLRFPTRLAGETLKALGAVAVGMPVPQVPEALAQRVIDGCVVPWEVVPSIKVQELVKYHTDFAGSPTLYTASFVLAMNRARYDGLAPDLRAIIDANSGQAAAAMAAASFDVTAPKVEAMAIARGNEVTTLSAEETARWTAASRPVLDAWLGTTKAAGIDGEMLLADMKAELARRAAA